MLRPFLIAVGILSLALGALGIVLPILPTTPFLLLSTYCFARSSTRLHTYLVNHRVFGTYIANYYNGTMTLGHKVRTLALLWVGILVSAWLIGKTITWIILPLIAVGVTIHIVTLAPRPQKTPVVVGAVEDDALR
ncbi:YbaN family protein [Corynebacterium breve]|uniref:YbaN family protein n=1 Tax=Corynebacterium breve TaxID=3049799 RepID=A0ABY8VEW3_9CORY|nr:YbaN family protein [Corynebacterium breve]WIM67652.1 YbaN family protein [Corynebacterium breve]